MVTNEVDNIRDEMKDYEDIRSIGLSEACWKLFAFPISENKPPVQVTVLLQLVLGYHLFSGFATTPQGSTTYCLCWR